MKERKMSLVAKKGPMPKNVREFIAKEIELFGRRWESGVTNKKRYQLSPSNKKKQLHQHHQTFVKLNVVKQYNLQRKHDCVN